MTDQQSIDFSAVLASSVHDMKNSLSLIIQSIDMLNMNSDHSQETSEELARLHYEANRLNTNLIQLLTVYRSEIQQMPLNIEEHYVDELFEEIVVKNALYTEKRNIKTDVDIDDEIAWLYDTDLISHLVNDMFINAMRYTKDTIRISAKVQQDQLIITVEDNGSGYPASMLELNHSKAATLDLTTGRTGLGIYFANIIAQAHKAGDTCGSIELSNGGALGGSVFSLKIP